MAMRNGRAVQRPQRGDRPTDRRTGLRQALMVVLLLLLLLRYYAFSLSLVIASLARLFLSLYSLLFFFFFAVASSE